MIQHIIKIKEVHLIKTTIVKRDKEVMRFIKYAGKRSCMSQAQIADKLHLSLSLMWKYSNGDRRISLPTTIKLLNVLGYDLAIVEKEEK